MHPPIHLAVSWLVGCALPERRDRRLLAWAGVVPDLDSLSLLAGVGAYSQYHHVLTHGLVAAVVTAGVWAALTRQRWKVMLLSLAVFHLHLLCDLVGSGIEGEDWPILYLFPFSRHEFIFHYGWDLASPENAAVWLAAVAASIWVGLVRGRTFAEAFLSARADAAIVKTLRKLLAHKPSPAGRP